MEVQGETRLAVPPVSGEDRHARPRHDVPEPHALVLGGGSEDPTVAVVVVGGGFVQGARRPSPETHGVEGLAVIPVHVALKQVNFGLVCGERGGVGGSAALFSACSKR